MMNENYLDVGLFQNVFTAQSSDAAVMLYKSTFRLLRDV